MLKIHIILSVNNRSSLLTCSEKSIIFTETEVQTKHFHSLKKYTFIGIVLVLLHIIYIYTYDATEKLAAIIYHKKNKDGYFFPIFRRLEHASSQQVECIVGRMKRDLMMNVEGGIALLLSITLQQHKGTNKRTSE